MNFEEQAAKPLLAAAGIAVPAGALAASPAEAADFAGRLGPVVVKAQVAAGKRGKAGGIMPADSAAEAAKVAAAILGMTIAGHKVETVLIEQRADITQELYAAVLNDPASRAPMVMVSTRGGMDIEEVAAQEPSAIHRQVVDILTGFGQADAAALINGLDLGGAGPAVAALVTLNSVFESTSISGPMPVSISTFSLSSSMPSVHSSQGVSRRSLAGS